MDAEIPSFGLRLNRFKNNAKDGVEMRRRRGLTMVELRKSRKDEELSKRRNLEGHEFLGGHEGSCSTYMGSEFTNLASIVEGIESPDSRRRFDAVIAARKLLSTGSPPIDEMVDVGILPCLIKCLDVNNAWLLLEVCWCFTNLLSGTSKQTERVTQSGVGPRLLAILRSTSNQHVQEQVVWAFGNMAGDGRIARDYCLSLGLVGPLMSLVKPRISLSLLKTIVWVLVNLCRIKDPPPGLNDVKRFLPVLIYSLAFHDDFTILMDSVWAFSCLTEGPEDYVELVVESGAVARLVPLLSHKRTKIQSVVLKTLGRITSGTNIQTQVVLDSGALNHFPALLCHSNKSVQKDAFWVLSNITAGDRVQVQAVIEANLIPVVIDHLGKNDIRTRVEAAWALSNVTATGTRAHVKYLVKKGVVRPLCDILALNEPELVSLALDSLKSILRISGTGFKSVANEIESCGGLDHIEALQTHENNAIYRVAYEIVDLYFSDDDLENGTLEPLTDELGQFAFGPDLEPKLLEF